MLFSVINIHPITLIIITNLYYYFINFSSIFFFFFSIFKCCSVPLPPTNVTVSSFNKHHITFTWRPPLNAATLTYSLKISSDFWGYSQSEMVQNQNRHTFSGLQSGTRYWFEVRTVAGKNLSTPANIFHSTGETSACLFPYSCSSHTNNSIKKSGFCRDAFTTNGISPIQILALVI